MSPVPETSALAMSPIPSNIVFPIKIKKRGRPKGSQQTVIGLPRKKLGVKKVLPFLMKTTTDRAKQILLWFVSEEDASLALQGSLLNESMVEQNPKNVPNSCLSDKVNIWDIRRYFHNDGWQAVEHIYNIKKNSPNWCCVVCKTDLYVYTSCMCDSCLCWYHLKCIWKRTPPKAKNWFCRECHNL